ncbi:SLC13 family permease [Pelagicoccus mobilis]|uniref:DASS family sodium-coupled anion symporter n=1 Tax=Pelagicoccus mobilis TaxID=415221 RepID=A0A934S033_9BACT|nr:DASS family sodium-coupled anion symporter [Pelagicoccus mobilis]MBK1878519.1 DASS family sodium-coupled anion symporter [Pelagicoccus mobilis]
MKRLNWKRFGFWFGLLALLCCLSFEPPFEGMSVQAWRTAGLGMLMAIWWMTECLPLAATSFLPIVIAPTIGLISVKEVTSAYANPLIYLFLGGFLLSIAMERTGLHLRIARAVVSSISSSPRSQIGGMMAVAAFLSMWMSNTATTIMMLPVALSTASFLVKQGKAMPGFGPVLLLSVAYAASIGGMATLIGTPPNALLAAYLENSYGIEIGFAQWMLFGVPFSIVMLVGTWLLLTARMQRVGPSAVESQSDEERFGKLDAISRDEIAVAVIFGVAALGWIFRSHLNEWLGLAVSDTGIAMAAALLLFIVPSGRREGKGLLEWKDTGSVPWGVLLLFGGGLALASLMKSSGLATYVGGLFEGLSGMGTIWVVAVVALVVVFLTEVTSNTATTAGLLPLMGPIALTLGESPLLLAIPTAVVASCAFMLPVATPPNAIVFASGELKISQMMRAGIYLNLVSVALLVAFSKWLLPLVF